MKSKFRHRNFRRRDAMAVKPCFESASYSKIAVNLMPRCHNASVHMARFASAFWKSYSHFQGLRYFPKQFEGVT